MHADQGWITSERIDGSGREVVNLLVRDTLDEDERGLPHLVGVADQDFPLAIVLVAYRAAAENSGNVATSSPSATMTQPDP